MIDFIKATTKQPDLIERLYRCALIKMKPRQLQNRNYVCFSNGSGRFRIAFRKSFENGIMVGFYNAEIAFSPHYYFNDDLHNGNDFSPADCISTIRIITKELQIDESEMQDFKVVNLEYGLNLEPDTNIETLINGIIFTRRTPFRLNKAEYSKISNSTTFKEIKAYAKGLQFLDNPEYRISVNCFRFEVKNKQYKAIKRLGIHTLADLTNRDRYSALFQSILSEWENILVVNVEVRNSQNTKQFWDALLEQSHRDKFSREKKKYYQTIPKKYSLNHQIKCKIIDKLYQFESVADSTPATTINTVKKECEEIPPRLIKVEYATKTDSKNPICAITGEDISMQRAGNPHLKRDGLRHLYNTNPTRFWNLYSQCQDTATKHNAKTIDEKILFLEVIIRKRHTNPKWKAALYHQRNGNPNQLKLFHQC